MLNNCLVVLNYNDLERCLNVLKYGMDTCLFKYYVLVDNASRDFNDELLNNVDFSNVIVLKNKKNLGYGAGHNVGLRYAVEVLKADNVAVIVSDIEYTENNIKNCMTVLRADPKIGSVTCRMKDINGIESEAAWRTPGYKDYVFWCFPIMRKCMKKNPYSYDSNKLYTYVDVIRGSFMFFRSEAIKKCGYFDENVFLYNEENIMSARLKKAGYCMAIVNNQFYIHKHINRQGKRKSFGKLISEAESGVYYMEQYQNIRGVKLAFLKFSTYLLCSQRFLKQYFETRVKK